MKLRKLCTLATATVFLFVVGCLFGFAFTAPADAAPPEWAKKADKKDQSAAVTGAVDEDAEDQDKEEVTKVKPNWVNGHPSLRGLERAYANVVRNGASPRAQEVLKGLIEARTVAEEVYAAEELTEDEESFEEIAEDEELRDALLAQLHQTQARIRAEIRERKEQAWALRKLGVALKKLESEAAEALLRDAFKLNPTDGETAQALNEQFRLNGNKALKVFIRGGEVDFDVPPALINNRTMVPLRKLAESLGSNVDWNEGTQTVVFVQGSKMVSLKVGGLEAIIDGERVTLDTPALIVNKRVLVPLRFIGEALDTDVEFYAESNTVAVVEWED
ncbi:MAG: copper amine oxidase N-terminal domain-containing protein [Clostridia bacterium]|nr:copper amine oxidase N-terminal domain-containing protein [Clostridia bacterium]